MNKIRKSTAVFSVLVTGFVLLLASCGAQRKLTNVQARQMAATISLPLDQQLVRKNEVDTFQRIEQDTIKVEFEGQEVILMKAVLDEETGETVAAQEIKAAVVSARFRNVAERHGKIDLEFDITVPKEMQDPAWQLRFDPDMFILDDSIRLDRVIITGDQYRHRQLKGYEQYERWLSKIVSDTTKFIDLRNLEVFCQRNLPQIYAFKTDSSEVDDIVFESYYGVTEREAIDHYTNKLALNINNWRKSRKGAMYRKFVKAPIETEHIRLDTVMTSSNSDFVYRYVQTITTRPKLRKVDIVLSGEIYEQDKKLYVIPRSEPLTFFISSMATFVDNSERYLKKVVERHAEANASWDIEFKVGKADIEERLGDNAAQIANIKQNLRNILVNDVFTLDSVTIAAFASPEGSAKSNNILCERRARSAAAYFDRFVKHLQDSVKREAGVVVVMNEDGTQSSMRKAEVEMQKVRFLTSVGGENWDHLSFLIQTDTTLPRTEKLFYSVVSGKPDPDVREAAMRNRPQFYDYCRGKLYPKLRSVNFKFDLHRTAMTKDTVVTTVLDSVYMNGVQAIRDRDYELAVSLLMPYQDYNTAVALICLDRNFQAKRILDGLVQTAPVTYMQAILAARSGNEPEAVKLYVKACEKEPQYVWRGNLDPEIAALIKKYNLNLRKQDETTDTNM